MEYSHNFGSNFPDSLIPIGTKKDIDDSVKDLITQYYSYIENGKVTDAKSLYDQNKTLLEPYIIDMEYINRLEEEIWNTHVATLKKTHYNNIIQTTCITVRKLFLVTGVLKL